MILSKYRILICDLKNVTICIEYQYIFCPFFSDRRRVRQLRGLRIRKCYIGGTTWSSKCYIKVIHFLWLSRKKRYRLFNLVCPLV